LYKIENFCPEFNLRYIKKMASLSTHSNYDMMRSIHESIQKDITDGNCKPMEAVKRYDNIARTIGLPTATDDIVLLYKNLRAKFNKQRREARREAERTQGTLRRAVQMPFVSIRPPRSQRTAPTNNIVPEPPDCGGETKTTEPPMATEVIPIYNAWELDPTIPYAIAIV